MTLRGMAHDLAEAARAGDKEAQQKRVYYQGTLETDKGELSATSPRLARGGTTWTDARDRRFRSACREPMSSAVRNGGAGGRSRVVARGCHVA
jgi:hypothetical protein